jgi:uncharacterized protein involved in type VI secretion and phage assembly
MSITDLASYFFHQIRTQEEESGRIYEPVIGIVTDNKDPEKLARVKVKIPTLSSDDTTWWAPLIAQGAGKNRGWFFIPEIDDEVLVMFEHGDMSRPLIVGSLWNGKDKPPGSNSSGSNPKRLYKSRAGDLFELDDEGGKITISDGGGKGRIVIDKSNKITIEALSGDVCIQAPAGDLAIVCKDAELTATAGLDIVSQQGVKLGSDDAATIKAGGMMGVSAQPFAVQGGQAQAPSAPTASPAEIADPIPD